MVPRMLTLPFWEERRNRREPPNTEANITVKSEGSRSVGGPYKPSTSVGLKGAHEWDKATDPAMNSTCSTFHLLLRCSRDRAFSIDKWTSEIASWWARSLMCFMPSFTWVSSSLNNCQKEPFVRGRRVKRTEETRKTNTTLSALNRKILCGSACEPGKSLPSRRWCNGVLFASVCLIV